MLSLDFLYMDYYRYSFVIAIVLISIICGGIGGTFMYCYDLNHLRNAVNNSYRTEVMQMFKDVCSEKDCEIIYKK